MKYIKKYYWLHKWWAIRDFFQPKQKWLTKTIPNHWCDKVSLLKDIPFECLIHFVEKEDGLKMLAYQLDDDQAGEERIQYFTEAHDDVKYAYEYIKNRRPALEKALDDAYPPHVDFEDMFGEPNEQGLYTMKTSEELYGAPHEEVYANVRKIEKEIDDTDQKVLHLIIKHRRTLWT